jgi:energy-coupling factor transporter ATP-binding protein EcfA2
VRERLRRQLREVQREVPVTTVLVTHDPAEAALLGDDVLVLAEGRVLQAGPVQVVFRQPAPPTVAGLRMREPCSSVGTSTCASLVEGFCRGAVRAIPVRRPPATMDLFSTWPSRRDWRPPSRGDESNAR